MFPNIGSQPNPYPSVQPCKKGLASSYTEVVYPSPCNHVQLFQHLLYADSTVAFGYRTNLFFQLFFRTLRHPGYATAFLVTESETEQMALVGTADFTFLSVYTQEEFILQKSCNALQYPFRRTLASDIDTAIIRIADETEFPLLQLFVQLVKQDVGEYGT